MRIVTLSPVSFGRFQNCEFRFAPGINLIEAPNEAGKSTLAAFVSGMLYGFYKRQDPRRRQRAATFDRYRPWANPGRYFGAMTFAHEGAVYRLERDFLMDEVRLFEADTGRDVTDRLPYHDALRIYEPGAYFLGISQSAFEGTLYVPQRSVETGGALGRELVDQIDALSAGGASASGALRWLDARRDAIGTPRRGGSPLGEQHARLARLLSEKAEAEARRSAAAREGARAQALLAEVAALEAAQRADEAALAQADGADEAALEDALEDLRRMRDINLESEAMARALDELDRRIDRAPALPEAWGGACADAPGRARRLMARYEALPPAKPHRALTALGACFAAAALAGFAFAPAFTLAAPAALFVALGILRRRENRQTGRARASILAALGVDSPGGFAGLIAALEEARDLATRRDTIEEQREGKLQQADALRRRVLRAMAACGLDAPPDETAAEAALRRRLRQIRDRGAAPGDPGAMKPDGRPDNGGRGALAQRVRARAARIRAQKEEAAACAARRDAIENAVRPPAEIEDEMRPVRAAIDALTREAEAIEEAKRRIEAAADEMRKRLSPALSRAIRRLSGAVTLGRYADLAVDTDLTIQVLADGRSASPAELSGGTADAIHLALRLGLIEFLMGGRECPILLDDSFSQLDDDRAGRMLEAVADFASGRQALIFTCQPRARRMLESLGVPFHAVRL